MKMKTPLRRWLAVVVLVALTPGTGELFENLGHLLVEGHLAHAEEQGDDHSAPGSEHGCNGTFHLCSCHSTQSFFKPSPSPLGRLPAAVDRLAATKPESARAGFHHVPERPPRV
jgi:hypothetical protein